MNPTLRTALRWLPTFVGFPLGGLLAELAGRVDDPGSALAGGAVTGGVLALVQYVGLRRTGAITGHDGDAPGPAPELWVAGTAAALAAGLALGAGLVDYGTATGDLAVQGIVSGAAVGIVQALLLGRRLGRMAPAWPVFLAATWALGWTITASIGVDVEAQYTVFGSSGAIVVTALTSALPIVLTRRAGHSAPLSAGRQAVSRRA